MTTRAFPSDDSESIDPELAAGYAASQRRKERERAPTLACEIIESDDQLAYVREALKTIGYAGDTRLCELIYVAVTSRLLERPLNLLLMGPSSAGKTYAVDTVLRMFPREAYHHMNAGSPRSWIYNEESFEHRTLVIAEGDSIPRSGSAASAIRSIVHDSRMDYEVTELDKRSGKHGTRRIRKQGPTGLITTGLGPLESQMMTRVLTLTMRDDPTQTREVLLAQARGAMRTGEPIGMDRMLRQLRAYQRWLASDGENIVAIPFAEKLARLYKADTVRARRDFKQLLAVIATLALMAQRRRQRADDGAVIASIDDYKQARRLVASTFDATAAGGVTPALRATVEAIGPEDEVSLGDLARRLDLSKSTVQYRVEKAIEGGWLRNLNEQAGSGQPFRLVRGEPLPEAPAALPTADDLRL